MNSIQQFSELIRHPSEKSWRDHIFKVGNSMGYEHALLAIVPHRKTPLEAGSAFLHSNYSPAWRNKYDAGRMELSDPTIYHCATRSTPLIWSPSVFSARRSKEMYEEACGYGLRSGVTLPIHGPKGELGMICFTSGANPNKRFKEHVHHHLPELSYFRDFIFETSLPFRKADGNSERTVDVTRRELECLHWAAAGKSSWDISQILNCSEAAVNFHFTNIRRKFGTTTRRHAVVKAIRLGLITPD